MLTVFTAAMLVVAGLASVRWLRIAQREHYIPGSTSRFAIRWWTSRPANTFLAVAAVAAAAASFGFEQAAYAALVAPAVAPIGLSVRGRSSKLNLTRRMRLVAAVSGLILLGSAAVFYLVGVPVGVLALLPMTLPLFVDAALGILNPIERAIGRQYVVRAERRLREVAPRVIAVTGSYGKTTTKEYIRHLTSTSRSVLASPASYNNQAGLSRTVNELLTGGTDVFVAEVGTYGPGEIRKICEWLRPDVGIITAIGPVHLERMRSIGTITRAKSEILETAGTAILNIDYPELDLLAKDVDPDRRLIRCTSTRSDGDVLVELESDKLAVTIHGEHLATVARNGVHPGNLACAVAAALEVGVDPQRIAAQLGTLPSPAHRQQVVRTAQGVTVIDNTYNSNPDAAKGSLELLAADAPAPRRIVVSPGIVELGSRQAAENESFARAASEVATDFVVVGRTNRRALLRGLLGSDASQHLVDTREEAVQWVRQTAGNGDVVLYENDLPDHYP